MCFHPDAPFYALCWMILHLLFYGVLFPQKTSEFAKQVRMFALLFSLAWIAMEFWDYGLWKAHVRGQCYDVVGISGQFTPYVVMASNNAMIWYQRGSLDGVDVRLWSLAAVAYSVIILVLSESDNWFPMEPLSSTRNTWLSDSKIYGSCTLPFYVIPALRGLHDNWYATERFPRMVKHIQLIGGFSWLLAVAFSLANWGSIWCLAVGGFVLVFDTHLFLDKLYPCDDAVSDAKMGNQAGIA
jgi:hypothetical protein